MPDKEKEVEKLLKRVHQVIEDAKTARDENRKLVAQMRELLKGSRFTGSMYNVF